MRPPTVDRPTASLPTEATAARHLEPARTDVRAADWPWWLWPHLLSLDAPLVACVWQRWWATTTQTALRPVQGLILFLGVWMIYIADRLADTGARSRGRHQTPRHLFCAEHRAGLRLAVVLGSLTLVVVTPRWLGTFEFRAGLGLLAVASGYFWLVHRRRERRWTAYVPKEVLVGVIFCAGSGFFVLCARRACSPDLLAGLVLFAPLCALNCALITKWEHSRADVEEPGSLLNRFPRTLPHLATGCIVLAVIGLAVAVTSRAPACAPIVVSALLLAWLDGKRAAFSSPALRMLADAVLLSPVLWLAF